MVVVKHLAIRKLYICFTCIFIVAVLIYVGLSFWELNTIKNESPAAEKQARPVSSSGDLVSDGGQSAQSFDEMRAIAEMNTRQSSQDTKPRMRILCIILTSGKTLGKMKAVNETWSKRCDKKLFMYSSAVESPVSPYTIHLPVLEGRDHLTGKVRKTLEHIYNQSRDSFDWILKCDDDTYVIMENLRHLLSDKDPKKPAYLGYRLNAFGENFQHLPDGYMSGGAGYVISSRALHDVVNKGFKMGACREDGGDEDVEMGKCLKASGVPMLSTLASDGKETFHPQDLHKHLTLNNDTVFRDPPRQLRNNGPWGESCCSRYPVSFHWVKPTEMYMFEYLIYNVSVHGAYK